MPNWRSVLRAAEVISGEYIPLEDLTEKGIGLTDYQDPEKILIRKSAFETMPTEIKQLYNVVENMPTSLFHKDGKVKMGELKKILRNKLGWSKKKTDSLETNLRKFFQSVI